MAKQILTATFILLNLYALPNTEELVTSQTIIRNGVGLGSVLAVVLSWDRNNSILLAIIHGIFSWLYVIYYALTR
jgi:hypothetical protein